MVVGWGGVVWGVGGGGNCGGQGWVGVWETAEAEKVLLLCGVCEQMYLRG